MVYISGWVVCTFPLLGFVPHPNLRGTLLILYGCYACVCIIEENNRGQTTFNPNNNWGQSKITVIDIGYSLQ